MTHTQLVEIQPHELKFTFEVKKQSSCAVHIANITDQHVAFKVKTTSPKKYCVRPNIGVIKPKSTYDFTVTMQAQRTAPSDMQCKDKFLIQCAVVPFGTSEEEIPPSMFNKDNGKYVEECKLKVVLVSPPHSPVLQPANGISKQGASIETSMQQEKFPSGVENLPPAQTVVENNKDADFDAEEEEPILAKTAEDVKLNSPKNMESNTNEVVKSRDLNTETKSSLTKDFEELKSKINSLDLQLIEAEYIIAKLKEEKLGTMKDMEILKQELVLLRTKGVGKRAQVGFPLFLCMVALICLTIGYLVRA
ncbi:hypothetical protein HAX54_000446 [Datura stramonium]|uniref:MSP domain-containing protein n=1 Tax=Datura stramonium TaxID=4076 RepID=A0ABS8WSL5_DATST|nr:hypothetical protein [Datura stramonium]